MNITKPTTLQSIAGAAIVVTLVSTLLAWATLDLKGAPSVQGIEFGRAKVVLALAIVALVLWLCATLALQAFPPTVQLPLMGAPVVLLLLGLVALLLVVLQFFDNGYEIVDRGVGLYLALVATLVWVIVTAVQTKQILDMAKAMKAAQQ